jgi:hypothetical protein
MTLGHPVRVMPDANALPANGVDLAAGPQGATPAKTNPPVASDTSGTQAMPAVGDCLSGGHCPHGIDLTDSNYYTRPGTDLRVLIQDDGRPLTSAERHALWNTLDRLPAEHFLGLDQITVKEGDPSNDIQDIPAKSNNLDLYLPAPEELSHQVDVSGALEMRFALHVYTNYLTDAERKAYEDEGNGASDAWSFRSDYMRWLNDSPAVFNDLKSDSGMWDWRGLMMACVFAQPGSNPPKVTMYDRQGNPYNAVIGHTDQSFTVGSDTFLLRYNSTYHMTQVYGWEDVSSAKTMSRVFQNSQPYLPLPLFDLLFARIPKS